MISLGSGTAIWSRVTFRVALLNGKPEEDSILFEVPEDSLKVAAAVALENCIFEDCETENVGLVGTRRQLNEFLEGVRNS